MSDVNKIVAAIIVAQRCSNPQFTLQTIMEQYTVFLRLLEEQDAEQQAEPDVAGYAAVTARAIG